MEVCDFDRTPASSNRPSVSLSRSGEDAAPLPDAFPQAKSTRIQHHLLKTSSSGPTIIDQDLSLPSSPCQDEFIIESHAEAQPHVLPEAENRSSSTGRASNVTEGSCHIMEYPRRAMSLVNRSSDRATSANSRRSGNDVHADGGVVNIDHHTSIPVSEPPSEGTFKSMAAGSEQERRALMDHQVQNGILPAQLGPDHHAHSQVSKVQAAFAGHTARPPSTTGRSHLFNYRQSHSKAAPFAGGSRKSPITAYERGNLLSESSTAVS